MVSYKSGSNLLNSIAVVSINATPNSEEIRYENIKLVLYDLDLDFELLSSLPTFVIMNLIESEVQSLYGMKPSKTLDRKTINENDNKQEQDDDKQQAEAQPTDNSNSVANRISPTQQSSNSLQSESESTATTQTSNQSSIGEFRIQDINGSFIILQGIEAAFFDFYNIGENLDAFIGAIDNYGGDVGKIFDDYMVGASLFVDFDDYGDYVEYGAYEDLLSSFQDDVLSFTLDKNTEDESGARTEVKKEETTTDSVKTETWFYDETNSPAAKVFTTILFDQQRNLKSTEITYDLPDFRKNDNDFGVNDRTTKDHYDNRGNAIRSDLTEYDPQLYQRVYKEYHDEIEGFYTSEKIYEGSSVDSKITYFQIITREINFDDQKMDEILREDENNDGTYEKLSLTIYDQLPVADEGGRIIEKYSYQETTDESGNTISRRTVIINEYDDFGELIKKTTETKTETKTESETVSEINQQYHSLAYYYTGNDDEVVIRTIFQNGSDDKKVDYAIFKGGEQVQDPEQITISNAIDVYFNNIEDKGFNSENFNKFDELELPNALKRNPDETGPIYQSFSEIDDSPNNSDSTNNPYDDGNVTEYYGDSRRLKLKKMIDENLDDQSRRSIETTYEDSDVNGIKSVFEQFFVQDSLIYEAHIDFEGSSYPSTPFSYTYSEYDIYNKYSDPIITYNDPGNSYVEGYFGSFKTDVLNDDSDNPIISKIYMFYDDTKIVNIEDPLTEYNIKVVNYQNQTSETYWDQDHDGYYDFMEDINGELSELDPNLDSFDNEQLKYFQIVYDDDYDSLTPLILHILDDISENNADQVIT